MRDDEQQAKSAHQTPEERDRRMDSFYRNVCNCGSCPDDVLAQVSSHVDTQTWTTKDGVEHTAPGLVERYMAWVRNRGVVAQSHETIREWEVAAFGEGPKGDGLFASAHGILAHAIFVSLGRYEYLKRKVAKSTTPRLTPGLTDEQRRDRMLSALDKVVEGKAMPAARQSKRDEDESRAKLREQAAEVIA